MKRLTDFPNIPFAQLPTPLYKLENLSRSCGKNLYIKRDDMTGVALGGNKVRKLEFLLADARGEGAATWSSPPAAPSPTTPCSPPPAPPAWGCAPSWC